MRANLTFTLHFSTEGNRIVQLLQLLRDQLNQHEEIEKDALVRIDRFTENGVEVSLIFHVLTDKQEKFTRVREEVLLQILNISSSQELHLVTKSNT
jgi:hypothetical protein